MADKMPKIGSKVHSGARSRFMPAQKPKDAKNTLFRILNIYRKWSKILFAAMILNALGSVLTVAIPYFVGAGFNAFFPETKTVRTAFLYEILLILIFLYLANWVMTTLNSIIMTRVSQRLVFVLRAEFFEKLQRLPLAFYDRRSHGDTMSRITNDVDNISSTIAQATNQLISSLLTITGSLVVMLYLNVTLTLAVLTSVPLVALLTKSITTKSRAYFLEQQKNLGLLNGLIEENISGLKLVKAFSRQEKVAGSFFDINQRLYESSKKAQIWSGFMMPFMNVINNIVFALVAIVGGILCADYGVLVGTVVSFLSYSKQFSHPLNSIAGMFNTIQQALAGAERVFEVLDEEEEAKEDRDAVNLNRVKGNVHFQGVSFSYHSGAYVLQDINFQVSAGETVAFVGETGAGKTTIVNLLLRFYDVDAGHIYIDGVDVQKIKKESLRKCFSVVLQDTCLFSGSILDNIRYGKPEATEAEAIQAAKLARAHSFIEKLPQGYQTQISGSVVSLSQGQRQLLAIARAVLSDNPILILDEATSSVDTKTEKEIQTALLRLMKNRTSFLIAHRLSTIRDADYIFVMKDGRIVEDGNHKQLLEQRGYYYSMVASQIGLDH